MPFGWRYRTRSTILASCTCCFDVKLRRKAVVLAYHRVLTPEQRDRTASQQGLVVEDGTFARQVALLTRLFTVLTLDEFADHLARRLPFRGPCCLITFDDGWIDNFENALPVLRAHKLPAVMFLPVNFIGRRRLFTREALTHLLVRAVAVSRKEPGRRDVLRAHLAPLGLDRVLDIDDEDPLPAVLMLVGAHRYAERAGVRGARGGALGRARRLGRRALRPGHLRRLAQRRTAGTGWVRVRRPRRRTSRVDTGLSVDGTVRSRVVQTRARRATCAVRAGLCVSERRDGTQTSPKP